MFSRFSNTASSVPVPVPGPGELPSRDPDLGSPGAIIKAASARLVPYDATSVGSDNTRATSSGPFAAEGGDPVDVPEGLSPLSVVKTEGARIVTRIPEQLADVASQVFGSPATALAVQHSGYETQYSALSATKPALFDAEAMNRDLVYTRYETDASEFTQEAIPSYRLNRYFEFLELALEPKDVLPRIRDPMCLVFRALVPDVVQSYRFFTRAQLDKIAVHHNITGTKALTADKRRTLLLNHLCNVGCAHTVFVFKGLSRARSNVEKKFVMGSKVPSTKHVRVLDHETMNARSERLLRGPTPLFEFSEDEPAADPLAYLDIPDQSLRKTIIREWQSQMSTEALKLKTCAVCAKQTSAVNFDTVASHSVNLQLLRNDMLPRKTWPTTYNFQAYGRALLCSAGLSNLEKPSLLSICIVCHASLRRGDMPRFALANFLYYGQEALPPDVKEAFDQSSLFERMLICRVRYNSVSCRFKASDYDPNEEEDAQKTLLRDKRKGVRGNVMVTPLDVVRLNDVLPPSAAVIRDTMSVIFIGKVPPTRQNITKLRPVLVRKSRVKRMIQFLLEHNPHYGRLDGFKGYSEENLNRLFDSMDRGKDEAVPCAVHIGHLAPNDAVESATGDYTRRNVDDDPESFSDQVLMENVGFTMGDDSARSFRDMKMLAVERCLAGKPFLAHRRGSEYIRDFDNPYLMSLAFPEEDPWGIGGILHPFRKVKITAEEQVSHLLTVHGGRFQRHSEFAFFYYNVLRKQLISTNMRYKSPKNNYRDVIDKMLNVDLEKLASLREKCKLNPLYSPVDEAEKNILTLMNSVGLVARHIPGSAGHKIKLRNEIRGVISYRGAPALFITLNPSDIDNPIVRLLSGEDITLEDISRGEDMDSWKRKIFAAKNPAACAIFFDLMIQKFISIVLRYGRPGRGLFGICTSYYIVVEAQGKGTLHAHMLVWLAGHLSPQSLRDKLEESEAFKTKMLAWLEDCIKSHMMNESLNVPRSAAFRPARIAGDPNPGTMPAPVLEDNDIDFDIEYAAYVDQLLIEYNWHVHLATCWKYLRRSEPKIDDNCRMGMNGETHLCTTVDPESFAITLRRLHPWIANYNDLVMFLFKCNMDIKFVGSGEAAKAFLYYVTDYISKPSLPVHAGLAALSHAISVTNTKFPQLSDESQSTAKEYVGAMTSTVNNMMGHQEISHPQVMSYLVGGGDHYTSDRFATLYWGAIKRYVDRCFGADVDSSPVDGDAEEYELEVALSLTAGTISASSQLMDYVFRCRSEGFQNLCLYDFIRRVGKRRRVVKEGPRTHATVDLWPGQFSSQTHPQFESHVQNVMKKPVIPVILGPKFHRSDRSHEERELWAKDVVILFKPWRTPFDLKSTEQTWLQVALEVQSDAEDWKLSVINNMNVLTECRDARQEHPRHNQRGETTATLSSADLDNLIETGDVVMREDNPYSVFQEGAEIAEHAVEDEAVKSLVGEQTLSALRLCLVEFIEPAASTEVGRVAAVTGEDRDFLKSCSRKMMQLRKRRRPERSEEEERENKRMRLQYAPDSFVSNLVPGSEIFRGPFITVRHRRIIDAVLEQKNIFSNPEQLRAMRIITKHVLDGGQQLLMYIAGVGGTGKSHLIKAIVEIFTRLGIRDALQIGAPTGISATLVGGYTLHSLTMTTPIGKSKDMEGLAALWRGVRYLIIDEISMVGAVMLSQLSSRLKQAMGDDEVKRMHPFGGINVIFCGDFGQLKPPRQHSLFAYELVKSPGFGEARNPDAISALNGAFLWRQVGVVVQLVQNQRHQGDPIYAEFLDRMRKGECIQRYHRRTPEGVSSDLEYLRNRELSAIARKDPESLSFFHDAPVIVGSKSVRDAVNTMLINYHARRLSAKVSLYHSSDSFSRKPLNDRLQDVVWKLPGAQTKDFLGQLPIFCGMKVMVLENVAFSIGVVNGAEGIVRDVKYTVDSRGNRIASVVLVYIANCGLKIDGLDADVVPMFPQTVRIEYRVKGSDGVLTTRTFTRKQIPIIPAYAYTDFKSQGRTLEYVIVDLATARTQGVYVMLSRVKSLKGLAILRWFPASKIYQRASQEMRSELERISSVDELTKQRFTAGEFDLRPAPVLSGVAPVIIGPPVSAA